MCRLTILILMSVLMPHAFAWECGESPEKLANAATLAFEGKVTHISPVTDKESNELIGRKITFAVSRTLSGEVEDNVSVITGIFGDSPGYPFLCGETYRVFANEHGNEARTDVSYPNKPIGDAPNYEQLEKLIFSGNTEAVKFQYYINKLTQCQDKQ